MTKARAVPGLHPTATLRENARRIIAVRVNEMFSFSSAIGDPTRDDDLHAMRIAAKRLRYSLEMFRPALGPHGPSLLDAVKEIQERIGAIHDADVLDGVARSHLMTVALRQALALDAAASTTVSAAADPARSLGDDVPGPHPIVPVEATATGDAPAQPAAMAVHQGGGDERATAIDQDVQRRLTAVRDVARVPDDPRLGLAALLARVRAERHQGADALGEWLGTYGGEALRARFDHAVP